MFKNLKKKLKDQRGLTLVELLAVIVILGIISAIAVPNIGNVISKSKDDAKVAEALQIIDAAKLAYANNSEVTSWNHAALTTYISKVNDTGLDYLVTYNVSSNTYSIKDHDAADTTTVDAGTSAGTLTEDQLATLAR